MNYQQCEWVENRHWVYEARLPDSWIECGGFIVWMGHDSFPCTANTSVIDYEGNLKPAALALADVFGNQGTD